MLYLPAEALGSWEGTLLEPTSCMGFVNVLNTDREQRQRLCLVGVGWGGARGPQTLVQIKGQFSGCPGDWRALSLSEQVWLPFLVLRSGLDCFWVKSHLV